MLTLNMVVYGITTQFPCIHIHTPARVSWGYLSSLKSTLDHHFLWMPTFLAILPTLYSINALMFKIFAYINFNHLAACNAEDAAVVSVPLFTCRNTLLVGPPSLCTLCKHVLAFISSKCCVHDRSYHFPNRATCVRLCSHILLIDLIWSRWWPHRHTLGITSTNLFLVEVSSLVLQGTLCSGCQSTGVMWQHRGKGRRRNRWLSRCSLLASGPPGSWHKVGDGWVTSAPTSELPIPQGTHTCTNDGREWRQKEKRAEEDEMVR